MRNKYGNRKVTVNGATFDSKREYNRYWELLLLERAGKISDLQRQVKFELLPAIYETIPRVSVKTGKELKPQKKQVEAAVNYIADFVYKDEQGKTVVEDTKGFKTKEYILKRKMMLYFHGIKIIEV